MLAVFAGLDTLLYAVATFLLLSVVVGLVRILRGPTARDRIMALMLLGTTGVALLIVLAAATGVAALRDGALALVALAALVVIVRIRAESARK